MINSYVTVLVLWGVCCSSVNVQKPRPWGCESLKTIYFYITVITCVSYKINKHYTLCSVEYVLMVTSVPEVMNVRDGVFMERLQLNDVNDCFSEWSRCCHNKCVSGCDLQVSLLFHTADLIQCQCLKSSHIVHSPSCY